MIGKRFGFLQIIGDSSKRDRSRQKFYKFRCDCGIEKDIGIAAVRRGVVVSCGCYAKKQRTKANTKHGMVGTLTYTTWDCMIQRCTNPNHKRYSDYGGRGINVCDEWKSFDVFLSDMGVRPEGCSIDRIDNNGNYCKNNCKWSTVYEQAINKRVSSKNKSGVTGVCFYKSKNKWVAHITRNGIAKHLGYFSSFDDPVKARKLAETML